MADVRKGNVRVRACGCFAHSGAWRGPAAVSLCTIITTLSRKLEPSEHPDDDLETERNYILGTKVLGLVAVLVGFLQEALAQPPSVPLQRQHWNLFLQPSERLICCHGVGGSGLISIDSNSLPFAPTNVPVTLITSWCAFRAGDSARAGAGTGEGRVAG